MVVKIQNNNINYVADPLLEIKKQDWIILRLLYLITSIDPSMHKVDEIQRSMRYIKQRYKTYMEGSKDDLIDRAFWMIAKDPVAQDSFTHIKDVRLIRDFNATIDYDNPKDDEITYFGATAAYIKPGSAHDF